MEIYVLMIRTCDSFEFIRKKIRIVRKFFNLSYREIYDHLYEQFFSNSRYKMTNQTLNLLREYLVSYTSENYVETVPLGSIRFGNSSGRMYYRYFEFMKERFKEETSSFIAESSEYFDKYYGVLKARPIGFQCDREILTK
jgi:hypothetical protein